jgi:hypothetical protein
MKPKVVDPKQTLWISGGIYTAIGVFLAIVDHPLVPLSYVFHLLPIAIGGAVGAAVVREKYGPWGVVPYILLEVYLIYACVANQTSISPLVLSAGIFPLTRGAIRWVAENGG